MSGDALALVGVTISALVALLVGVRSASTNSRSASAGEVQALGARLDAQQGRLDSLERTNRALYAYIARDHAVHLTNGWPIEAIPEEHA